MALHFGYRHDPLVGIFQMLARFLGSDRAGLQQQDAGNNLQAIGNPMLHLT